MRLELKGMTAGYGDVIAVRDVSLVVPSGKAVALLGPNGAGKTTLLSCASGLIRPRAGTVMVDGGDISKLAPEKRAGLGLCHVTEGRSIFRDLTVRDNLRMFSFAGQEADGLERAVEAFPRLGERMNQLAGTMSGGEQQMLALARAYARRPALILLDEVSMGLAPILVDEIFEFLARVAREGTGLLIVEQYVHKALQLADYVYVLARGRVVLMGDSGELEGSEIFDQYLGSEVASSTAV